MKFYSLYINFIIFVKIVFIILAIYGIYVKHTEKKEPTNKKVVTKYEQITFIKERVELLFKLLMAILLIYLFSPLRGKEIKKLDFETRLLLGLFGWILILTADWRTIIHNIPKGMQTVQTLLGDNNYNYKKKHNYPNNNQ